MRAPQRLLPLLLRVLEVTVRSEYPDLDVRPCRPEGCARRGRRGRGGPLGWSGRHAFVCMRDVQVLGARQTPQVMRGRRLIRMGRVGTVRGLSCGGGSPASGLMMGSPPREGATSRACFGRRERWRFPAERRSLLGAHFASKGPQRVNSVHKQEMSFLNDWFLAVCVHCSRVGCGEVGHVGIMGRE